MPPGVLEHLVDAVAQAVHVRLAGPVEVGQIAVLSQAVAQTVSGALVVINAADELPPADDLAHEALDAVQGHPPGFVGGQGGVYALTGPQQLEIEAARKL